MANQNFSLASQIKPKALFLALVNKYTYIGDNECTSYVKMEGMLMQIADSCFGLFGLRQCSAAPEGDQQL